MATIYVGPTSAGAADGTSWANRYGSLNAAEDRPVQAGDLVYVAPGTYRETLTVDVSGSAGSPITYVGDYTGANTDGTGGVVRITGSDNDQTAVRASAITASSKNYRTFRGFAIDTSSSYLVSLTDTQNWIIDGVHLHNLTGAVTGSCLRIAGANQLAVTLTNSFVASITASYQINWTHSSAVSNTGHAISNCIIEFFGFPAGPMYSDKVGGITVKNSSVSGGQYGILALNLAAGQAVTVNNCVLRASNVALFAGAVGMIVEDYNCFAGCATLRTNVSTGANSNTYPPLFDTRWFFEAVNGGSMVTPFDLASYSQLVNVAGTSPTATDLRGTSVIGAQREWGALEYDPDLDIEAGSSGGGGRRPRLWSM